MNYINTLREGENITEIYYCKNKTVAQGKTGKTYYNVTLQDKTGTIDAKIWDLTNAIAHFETGDYIQISGQVTSFNNNLQITIRRVRLAEEGEYDESEYMPYTPYNIDVMYNELLNMIESVKNPYLNQLLKSFFVDDKDFVARFKKASAAKSLHHSFIGGLLQHSLFVAKISDYLASIYKKIDRDLLVTAAICHDIGKVQELSEFPENDYTYEGNVIGHIIMGAMMLRERASQIEGFPENLRTNLVHCILAHHGKLEFGSPKKPMLIEAVALNFADDTDAKLEAFTEVLNTAPEGDNFLGKHFMFETNIFKTE
ncbi:MAG: HD domain-containing protein [Eubacterium sp.]|nr:HD domain-containing protein [Eubacterium sp.]